jgi:hypothetical protein
LTFAKRRLIKPSFPQNDNGKVLVHIGCGERSNPEFINVDAQPFAHATQAANPAEFTLRQKTIRKYNRLVDKVMSSELVQTILSDGFLDK